MRPLAAIEFFCLTVVSVPHKAAVCKRKLVGDKKAPAFERWRLFVYSTGRQQHVLSFEFVVKFWQDKKISSIAELEVAINGKIISLAYHSAKIENNAVTYNDTREIFEHDSVIQYTGDLRTLFEIRNSKDAFAELLRAFEQKAPLDKSLILRFHR